MDKLKSLLKPSPSRLILNQVYANRGVRLFLSVGTFIFKGEKAALFNNSHDTANPISIYLIQKM